MNIFDPKLSLEELAAIEWLSVRSINICLSADLTNLNQIIDFYRKNGSFLSIRNCGSKSENELTRICKKYILRTDKETSTTISNDPWSLLGSISPAKKAVFNKYFDYLLFQLSVRAYNALKLLCPELRMDMILEIIALDNLDLKKIPNVGEKTIKELNELKPLIFDFLNLLGELPEDKVKLEYVKILLKSQNLPIPDELSEIFTFDNRVKLFALINLLIESGKIFNENEKIIFEWIYTFKSPNLDNFEKIARNLNLTRERVRQIKVNIESEIELYFSFAKNFTLEDVAVYPIVLDVHTQIINIEFSESINQLESVKYRPVFYATIFGLLLKDYHRLLNIEESLSKKFKNLKPRNYYLIANDIYSSIDLTKLIFSISELLSERVVENYSLHFEGFIMTFCSTIDKKGFKLIVDCCKQILYNEFEIIIDQDGYFTILSNSRKQLHQYCYDILQETSKSMTVDQIINALTLKYPEVKFTIDSIRGSLIREKGLFICFGRTSTYALREWEDERENLKGGTIRDIVYSLLLNQELPVHISEVWKHTEQYRGESNSRSVLHNLKADERNRFRILEGGFIGLQSKNYNLGDLKYKRLVGSLFTISTLQKFNGWALTEFIAHYQMRYGYQPVQIEYALLNKIENGEIQISIDKRLSI